MSFRRFVIDRKAPESDVITSFHLRPCDGLPVWPALPGQYLTLRIPAIDGPLLRTYSISTDVANVDATRISVKREAAPVDAPGAPAGTGSSWLHDHTEPGTEIEIAAPRGSFVLDQSSERPVVLVSGGVGQTPLVSMLHSLAHGARQVWYIHACENGAVHALHDEVKSLISSAGDRLHQHVCYRSPSEADHVAARFDTDGLIDKTLLQSLLPIDDYDCYLCGPTPFMVAMYRLLIDLGVADTRIRYEFFGKAKSLPALASELAMKDSLASSRGDSLSAKVGSRGPAALARLTNLTDPDARAIPDQPPSPGLRQTLAGHSANGTGTGTGTVSSDAAEVVFAKSGVSVPWSGAAGSLLDLAEAAGLAPEFSCRSGICNTCVCGVREGEVDYFEEPLQPPEPGSVLICCSRPRGRVVLDL